MKSHQQQQKQATVSSVYVMVILPRLEFIYHQLCVLLYSFIPRDDVIP